MLDEDPGDVADLCLRSDRQHFVGHDLVDFHRVLLSDGFMVARGGEASIRLAADSTCGELPKAREGGWAALS